ncbi:hypothetical protein VTO42DRAFT_4199 [Malbranchea cinnamomea]
MRSNEQRVLQRSGRGFGKLAVMRHALGLRVKDQQKEGDLERWAGTVRYTSRNLLGDASLERQAKILSKRGARNPHNSPEHGL